MPAARDPIGVLDSGLGGLSVLKALREELPNEQFLYCADCAHTPWGDKPESFIVERTRAIVHFLLRKQAKAVVLACNTATAAAADILRKELSIPIIGIEPAVKPAAAQTRTGVIGVIATRRTTESARYLSLLRRFAGNVKVVTVAAPGLMECVERGDFNSETTRELQTRARLYALPVSFRSNLGNHGARSGTVGTGQTRCTCRTHATSKSRSVKLVFQRYFPLHLLCCRCRKTPSNT